MQQSKPLFHVCFYCFTRIGPLTEHDTFTKMMTDDLVAATAHQI